ncbi:GNAT family N-acetyltransferase [Glaciibacter flavus]|uniref:GNAT family N-acetyltransferase n=1 Tax=Orlajensenia flava TaxID=2565934 RepID=UPI003AFF8907
MDHDEASVLQTARLLLRPWRITDASFHRQLWSERDPRVPAHRRITLDGHPTLSELEKWIMAYEPVPAPGLLVVERKTSGEVMGYCGLLPNSAGRADEPELAYEFLHAFWGQGFATEASRVILDRADALDYPSLASTVREWNDASLRVLEKLGFVNTGEVEPDDVHGDSLHLRRAI